MAEGLELGSDEWYADHLLQLLAADYTRIGKCFKYRKGENVLAQYGAGRSLSEFNAIVDLARLNFAWQIVSAHVSRKSLVSMATAEASDPDGDPEAAALFARSRFGRQYDAAALSKATYGRGYVTVLEGETPEETVMVATDAFRTITMPDPVRPWLSEAAVTIGWNAGLATDTVTLHRAGVKGAPGYSVTWSKVQEGGTSEFPAPEDDVPLSVPDLLSGDWEMKKSPYKSMTECAVTLFDTEDGLGEFEKHYTTLDRINHTILQRVIITIMQAFKQRAVDGDFDAKYPEGHPKAGEEIDFDELFKAGPDALWFLPEGAKMWESGPVDISPLLAAAAQDLKDLAAASSTPLYVLAPEAASGSATGAELARETHFLKMARDRSRDADSLASVWSSAFLASGDEARSVVAGLTPVWQSTALVSEMEKATVFQTLRAGGASYEFAYMRAYGLTQPELLRERQARQKDNLTGGLAASTQSSSGANAGAVQPASGLSARAAATVGGSFATGGTAV